jgi:hypothetical protein
MFKNSQALMIRGALAVVWAYQGVWCKLLRPDGRHRAIVEAAGIGWALSAIGVVEGVIAVWVLVGSWPVWAAMVQTALIVAMNAGGLWRGRRWIPDPVGMLLQNTAFLMLAWVAAGVLHVS